MKPGRVLSFLMSFVMVLSVFSGVTFSSFAADDPTVELETAYDSETGEVTLDVVLKNMSGHSTAAIGISYPKDVLEFAGYETHTIDGTNKSSVAGLRTDNMGLGLAVMSSSGFNSDELRPVTFKLKKIADADEAVFEITSDSTVDDSISVSGSASVDISAVYVPAPGLTFDSSFDESSRILTLTVSACNMKGHTTITGFIDFPTGEVEYISSEKLNTKYIIECGLRFDNNALFAAVMTTKEFREDSFEIAEFKLKVKDFVNSVEFNVTSDSVVDDSIAMTGSYEVSIPNSGDAGSVRIESSFDDSTKLLTVELYAVGAKESADVFFSYPSDILEFVSAEGADNDAVISEAGSPQTGMLSCAAVIPDESDSSQRVKIAEYVLKKTGNADSVTFTLTDGSAVDGNAVSGSFVVDIAPVGEAPKLVFDSSFDFETRTLTLDVSFANVKGHTTVMAFVDFPYNDLEFISARDYGNDSYFMTAGLTTSSRTVSVGAMTRGEGFAENTIKLATFTFKVKDGVDSVKFSVNSDSAVDDVIRIEPGDYTVSTKSRSATDPAADVRFAFDPSTRLLTATVTALNLKGHTTALIFLGFNKSEVEFASARELYISDSEIDVVCGLTTDGMNLSSAILKFPFRSTFTEDFIDISEFTLHVKPGVEKVTLTVANGSVYDDEIPVAVDSFTFNVLGDSSGTCTHSNTKTEPALAPTCTADGHTEKIICLDCGKVIKDSETVPALGHKEVKVYGKSATCTEKGLSDGTKCSVCGAVIKAQKEIPALGHKEGKVDGTPATCTEKGLSDGTKCSVCGEVIKAREEIPALGHTEVKVDGKSATCTENGLTDGTKCSVCGAVIKAQEKIPALGHSFENGVCTVCSAKDPDYTLKLVEDHDRNISLDNDKKTVTSKPTSSKSMTVSELKKQFGADIKLDLKDDDLVPNGTKFTYSDVEYTIIVKGDTAADGKITASDARAILRMAAKLDNPDDVTAAAADLNSDGKISSSEARNVLRFAAKLSSSLEG
ncbi:MAG: dockerin type I repeat-containing protein [Oscillospiraceae bacterium]|nr:dockerin type I repeat-containing protein [Oscillospiraceae bacterium]